jgi:hypothetical protein
MTDYTTALYESEIRRAKSRRRRAEQKRQAIAGAFWFCVFVLVVGLFDGIIK